MGVKRLFINTESLKLVDQVTTHDDLRLDQNLRSRHSEISEYEIQYSTTKNSKVTHLYFLCVEIFVLNGYTKGYFSGGKFALFDVWSFHFVKKSECLHLILVLRSKELTDRLRGKYREDKTVRNQLCSYTDPSVWGTF